MTLRKCGRNASLHYSSAVKNFEKMYFNFCNYLFCCMLIIQILLHVSNNRSKTKKSMGNPVGMLNTALKFDSHCYVEQVLQPHNKGRKGCGSLCKWSLIE